MMYTVKEVKARHSPVVVLADAEDESIGSLADHVIRLPHVPDLLSPVISVIPLQLMAYYYAKLKGCPIDYPRNLAKSVTVEKMIIDNN